MRPVVLSCGDPAGIGPEIAYKAWAMLAAEQVFFMIGDPRHLPQGAKWVEIQHPQEAADAMPQGLPILAHPFPNTSIPGQPDPRNAQAIIDVIARGVGFVQSGEAIGLCTAPINKQALKEGAQFAYPGHTEYLAALAGNPPVVMMLACDALKVVPATIHIPLADVPNVLDAESLAQTITVTHHALQTDFGVSQPTLAVAGLNPHAGEGGTMGHEEQDWISPLLDQLRSDGFDIIGPLSADTMFHEQARSRYDAAIAMYHDQALIPIKTLDFAGGVNVTLGLPFVRTSPDHGTAYDIAGRDIASPDSLVAALRLCARMGQARQKGAKVDGGH